MTQQAAKEFGEIQQSLQQLSQQMNFADQLNAPQQTLDQVANQQGQSWRTTHRVEAYDAIK